MSTWLITGCSTGFGRAFATAVLEAGHNVIVTARNADRVKDLADAYPETALARSLDVTDADQAHAVVSAAQERFGRIHVLVNNAGYGFRGAVEEASMAEIQQQFATNTFGAVTMMQAVLPGMRAHRSGAIVNMTSIGARIAFAGSGYYAASKAALEALSMAAAKELAPLGITVTAVEPGAFRTDFAGRSLIEADQVIQDYDDTAGKRRKVNDTSDGNQMGDPIKAAQVIIAAVEAEQTPTLLILGPDALDAYEQIIAAERKQIDAWHDQIVSTSYTDA